ncbi:MAG: nucleotidyl transferase AbiEii/AbiGii toxin family protein [Caldilineaceae bacterium SB0665_bin_21]|nr:nucleotidyl transferase AbiEii/AbiGii toxin family protein [Caldilineaceae bacterium SB0665_bin_21]MYC62146.1 nucleotidyl transferase AbiEii/AbiGii toxin family protein [Caldilineaceae bacterium SB0661_bin_34]
MSNRVAFTPGDGDHDRRSFAELSSSVPTGEDALLTEGILTFMAGYPSSERIFRRCELSHLGTEQDIDGALRQLQLAHRVGSPAPDIWFPLTPWTDTQGVLRYAPPASLKELGRSLLLREGVGLTESKAERDYRLSWETDQREGVWGVPTFAEIGVESSEPLRLRWGRATIHSEYEDRILDTYNPPCTAYEILDPAEFQDEAARIGEDPVRLEKDLYVNRAINVLADLDPPHGCLAFEGGTALTKAWRMYSRFSEALDFRFLPSDAKTGTSVEIKRAVHAHVVDHLIANLLPHLPNGRLRMRYSRFRDKAPVQRVICNYDTSLPVRSDVVTGIKVEIAFLNAQIPVVDMSCVNNPAVVPHTQETELGIVSCVLPWVILAGKVAALTERVPVWEGMELHLRSADFMRHLVDLYLCRVVYPSPATVADMRFQLPQSNDELANRLHHTCRCLRTDPFYARAFQAYQERMLVGQTSPRLSFELAVDNFEQLGLRLLAI